MTSRAKHIILILAVLILIALIVVIFWFLRPPASPGHNESAIPTSSAPPLPPLAPSVTIAPAPPGPQAQNPTVVAADFTERYGSYSNQNNYQNLRDLMPQMTDSERASITAYIASHPLAAGDYDGVTTKAVRVEVLAQTDTTMKARVHTQRVESTKTNPESKITYQNADLALVKDGLRWLIDTFVWK